MSADCFYYISTPQNSWLRYSHIKNPITNENTIHGKQKNNGYIFMCIMQYHANTHKLNKYTTLLLSK